MIRIVGATNMAMRIMTTVGGHTANIA